jgi:glycosyltransferase involved in cell wall biosynthesis
VKVALVTSIPRGGPVEHALLLARDLGALGVDVRAVAADAATAARFAERGARAAVLPLRSPGDARGAAAVHRFVRGVDVVHSHDRRSGLWVRLGPRPARGAVRAHTLHGLPEPFLPPPAGPARPGLRGRLAYAGLERRLAARTDLLIAPTDAAAALLASRVGYTREQIRVVPNGVDLPAEPASGGELIGTLAALDPVKGVDVFLRAAAVLAAERPGLRFAVFGTGPEEPALRAEAARLGLDVAFRGHVPAADALAELRVFVQASHMETSGLALLQAMAAGVVAVATRVGGIPETAPPGTAELVPPGDPAAIAAAVARLLDDPALAAERRRAGRAAATARSARVTAERVLAEYEAALARRSPGRVRSRA